MYPPPERQEISRPIVFLQGLFGLPKSSWMAILSMSFVGLFAFFFNEWSVREIRKNSDELTTLMSMQSELIEFRARISDAETGQRGFLLSRDPRYLEPYKTALDLLPTINTRLQVLAGTDVELVSLVRKLEALRGQKISELRATVMLTQRGNTDEALLFMRTGEGRAIMDSIRGESSDFYAKLDQRVTASRVKADRSRQISRLAFAALTLVTLLLVLFAIRLLIKDYWRQVGATALQRSERQRLEELVHKRTKELSNLSTYLQSVAEQEKAELAHNLHDELGGLLTAVKMDIAWLRGRASAREPESLAKLNEIADGIDEAMNVKRRVVENLRPALLDHFGLPTALQAHFDETCAKAGLNCRASIPTDIEDIPEPVAIALFRVGQEALTNIIRHARAKNVELTFKVDEDNYCIEITDDGVGIDGAKVTRAASQGLAGMRHRISTLNGQFKIGTYGPRGTQVVVVVPRVCLV